MVDSVDNVDISTRVHWSDDHEGGVSLPWVHLWLLGVFVTKSGPSLLHHYVYHLKYPPPGTRQSIQTAGHKISPQQEPGSAQLTLVLVQIEIIVGVFGPFLAAFRENNSSVGVR